MVRAVLLAGAAILMTLPASAQGFQGLGDWRPMFSTRDGGESQRAAGSRSVNRISAPAWSPFGDDDDDGQRRRGQRSGGLTSLTKSPPVLEGGPRPGIAPASPATVPFTSGYAAGSVVIDTGGRALYYVLSSTRAYRYPIAVGREGFTWTGTETVTRKAPWPDWRPPKEMRERDPRLPELMTGGLRNPLGAMAIYLGNTLYRIHGTNDARSIGTASSSGCFRMTNAHVMHLSSLVNVGTTVHVLRSLPASVRRNLAGGGGLAPALPGGAS